jgi:hypothetical protein
MKTTIRIAAASMIACAGSSAAADFSDTAISYRVGSRFAEPYNPEHIGKNILNLSHIRGGAYGTDFVSLDVLKSNHVDSHATEAYLLYRHMFALSERYGFTVGFDANTKDDPGYGTEKRMLVVGPTLRLPVKGVLNVSLFGLWESNHPIGIAERYHYRTHPMLNAVWSLPIGQSKWVFEGYLNFIGAKGRDEFGGPTEPETNFDGQVMYDVSHWAGRKPGTFRAGFEYQYWRNKFGNPHRVPGSLAKTPMLRAEVHF